MNILLVSAIIINGVITAINGSMLTLKTCEDTITVDAEAAIAAQKTAPLTIGKNVIVLGEQEGDVFKAISIANKRLNCPL